MNTFNVLFTGVGGTGVLTAARILASAALKEGKNVRMGEIHGMAQRGGAVICAIRIGEKVRGPIISTGSADLLLSVEPIEALRNADKISPDGTIVVGQYRITPTAVLLGRAEYPTDDEILEDLQKFAQVVTLDAAQLAREAGNIFTVNTVLLGVVYGLGKIPLKEKSIITALLEILPKRYHQVNLEAFEKGKGAGQTAKA